MTVAVDSNTYIYVLEQNPEFYQEALHVLKAVEAGAIKGVASELVYLEALSSSRLNEKQVDGGKRFLETTRTRFTAINQNVLLEAARLRCQYPGLKTPDALHAAGALLAKADYLVTNDQGIHKLKLSNMKTISLAQAAQL